MGWPSGYHRRELDCWSNLQHNIGMAIPVWGNEHPGQYPFNVSTNFGGTLELCARDRNGFDSNAALHFQVMSNELGDPSVLVCPNDSRRKAAPDFRRLQFTNISYRLRTGTNVNQNNPAEVLAVCPIDGNVLYCSGEAKLRSEGKNPKLSFAESWHEHDWFRDRVEITLSLLLVGVLLFVLGSRLKRKGRPA